MAKGHKRFAHLLVLGPALTTVLLLMITPPFNAALDEHTMMKLDRCEGADFTPALALKGGIIASPRGISLALLEAQARVKVASNSFHLAAPGINRIARIFDDKHADNRALAAAPFDYLAVCRHKVEMADSGLSLYRTLVRGEAWPGLELIGLGKNGKFALYQIKHSDFK